MVDYQEVGLLDLTGYIQNYMQNTLIPTQIPKSLIALQHWLQLQNLITESSSVWVKLLRYKSLNIPPRAQFLPI